jgi:hypothetical protein
MGPNFRRSVNPAGRSLYLGADMNDVEKMARAMARADDVDPDQPLKGMRRIVGRSMIVEKYDRHLPAWNYYVPLAKVFIAASATL